MSYFSEEPRHRSPMHEYYGRLRDIDEPERDRVMAITALHEHMTGEEVSDRLLRSLVYVSYEQRLADVEQMSTYPVTVYGHHLERRHSPQVAVQEYARALRHTLQLTSDAHDDQCLVRSKHETGVFCPVEEMTDFMGDELVNFNFAGLEYTIDPVDRYERVVIRGKGLALGFEASNQQLSGIYEEYVSRYQAAFSELFRDSAELLSR